MAALHSQLHFSFFEGSIAVHDKNTGSVALMTYGLNGDGWDVVLAVQLQVGFGIKPGNQEPLRITHIHFRVHGAGICAYVDREARHFPWKGTVQRRYLHIDGIADTNVTDIGFWNRDDEAEQIIF